MSKKDEKWWFGGVAGSAACVFTHPIDTLKIRLQTNVTKIPIQQLLVPVSSLFNGISASILRQATYSTTRFAMYGFGKKLILEKSGKDHLTVLQSLSVAAVSGIGGGIAGTPADMVNIRCQNDSRLPEALRRNYRNVFHGLFCIVKDEGGVGTLFKGIYSNMLRSMLMNVSQVACYDLIKNYLIHEHSSIFKDGFKTHLSASLISGLVATTVSNPVDVVKTRIMTEGNANTSTGKMFAKVFKQEGSRAFMKGWSASYIRLGPHTTLMFLFFEQIKKRFG